MDDRLKLSTRGCVTQSLLEELHGPIDALELGEEQQRLSPHVGNVGFGQKIGCDRPPARPLAGHLMRTGCAQRPSLELVTSVRRGQPKRMLGELGRDRRSAAPPCLVRPLVE